VPVSQSAATPTGGTAGGVYDAADIKFSMGGSWAAAVTVLEPGKAPVLVTTVFQVTE
jgi:hypothetical protein